jgi:hypothetical protein
MCDFQIPFSTPVADLIDKANHSITKMGGTFTGDSQTGNFSISTPVGKIAGSYTVGTGTLDIHIDDKPFFVSCGMIEDQLTKALA